MGVGAIPAGDRGGAAVLRDAGTLSAELLDPRPGAAIGLSRSRTFIPELESLRGIAVLLVVAFHVHGFVLFPFGAVTDRASLPMAFVRGGHAGVDLFFLLSAFL